jgi:hypothetical protein
MLPLYLRAQELGGALDVADELSATDKPRRSAVCRGRVVPTLQEAPIVAIADRRPEVLRGPRLGAGTQQHVAAKAARAKRRRRLMALMESRPSGLKTNRAVPPAGVAGSAGSDSSQHAGSAGVG